MARRARTYSPGIQPNLTPMVDVVFLLIIFFIVVAQITTSERLELTIPRLLDSRTIDPGEERRIVVNVVPRSEVATVGGDFLMSGDVFAINDEGVGALIDRLSAIRGRDPAVAVSVRADRVESYDRVHEALRACAEAGVTRVNLIAEPVEAVR